MLNCEGQSYETVHKPQPLWGERRAKAELSRGPSAFQPNTWLLGQTGSLLTVLMYCMDVSMYVICIGCRRLVVHTQKEWMIPGSWNLCFCAGNQESDCCSGCCQSKGRAHLHKVQSHWFVHECIVYLYGSENQTAAMAAIKVRAVHMTLTQSTVTLICSCLHRLQLHWFVCECIVYLYGSENETAAVASVKERARAAHYTYGYSQTDLYINALCTYIYIYMCNV